MAFNGVNMPPYAPQSYLLMDDDVIIFEKKSLERLYRKYNRRKYIHPDPLEFIYKYESDSDREVVGLIASSLAYGRVSHILKSVSHVLSVLGPSPARHVRKVSARSLSYSFRGFKHRFTTDRNMTDLLVGIKRILSDYGSLKSCFLSFYDDTQRDYLASITGFTGVLTADMSYNCFLAPSPSAGSACKRMNLYLRWMVRKDDVDPGCWRELPHSKLVVPLDVHMFNIANTLCLTSRKSADIATAMEVTEAFRKINPNDPVKYDFSLTRTGIRKNNLKNRKTPHL